MPTKTREAPSSKAIEVGIDDLANNTRKYLDKIVAIEGYVHDFTRTNLDVTFRLYHSRGSSSLSAKIKFELPSGVSMDSMKMLDDFEKVRVVGKVSEPWTTSPKIQAEEYGVGWQKRRG